MAQSGDAVKTTVERQREVQEALKKEAERIRKEREEKDKKETPR